MISIILPYWDRQQAADTALASLEKCYSDLDLEVIVVDDGGKIPFVNNSSLPVRVIRMPDKDDPKSPLSCWNEGVRQARGEIIVLSCIEVIHEEPILEKMREELLKLGKSGYVLASAWCPEDGRWHCHSSVELPRNPPGTGIGFCAMLFKGLFDKAGGFDEDYRDGAGYEDCDWINRLLKVKAQFKICDDLKVIHPKTGASIQWGEKKFIRNFDLYCKKWPGYKGTTRLNFVCVNIGNYQGRGSEYANILFDMVIRNSPHGTPIRFYCLTDDAAGLDPRIQPIMVPAGIEGWWGKLYLFKRDLFPKGERMIFFDLDTVIIGSLDFLTDYRGEMAILRDFYQPNRGAPGVILWEAGTHSDIWEEWEACGRPKNPMGDLGWIENLDQGRYTKRLPRLQTLFPSKFVSYKAHCKPYPPKGAAVVCFHGEPRPHNCNQAWVETIWRIGGGMSSELTTVINTSFEKLWENMQANEKRGLPRLKILPEIKGDILIVGGGPSLKGDLAEIKRMRDKGAVVAALNGAADYLHDAGITVDWQIILDAKPCNERFVRTQVALRYFLSVTADPSVYDAISGRNITVFHPLIAEMDERVTGEANLLGGGSTVGLLAMSIAYTQGFRRIHLYGYDSSFIDGHHHAYTQEWNDDDTVVDVVVEGRKFKAAAWMVTQVTEFQTLAANLAEFGCEIHTHGTGLLPHVAWCMTHKEAAA